MSVKILDCTLRDGGYVNDWHFSNEQILNLYKILNCNKIDYMELGFKNFRKGTNFGELYYCEENYINKLFEYIDTSDCKLCIMCELGKFDSSLFVPKSESKISMVRVLMAYHSIKNTSDDNIDFKTLDDGIIEINKLIDLGYDVTFNIGRIDKITEEQLYKICKRIASTQVKYFIMADTYGSLDLKSTKKYVSYTKELFRNEFKTDIKIGFHAHDNYKNATSKTLYSIECGADIIDGCTHGFGRGSGNAITELLMLDFNKNFNKNYNFIDLMLYGQKYLSVYDNADTILSRKDILYILTAYYGMHVNYAIEAIDRNILIEEANKAYIKICEMKKNMYYYSELLFDTINHYDENNNIINHKILERTEQLLAQKYIDYDDIVLELGARYGTVSCAINNKLNKKTNQLVVDPDTRIIDALTKNKINHGCKFNIFNGIITNEKFKLFGEWRNYGVTTVKASENDMNIIPHKTLLELSNEYNLQFNTLFADCEGFLEQFINENIDYIPNFNKIIYEKDYQETCNYENIKNKLLDLGFKIILDDFIDEYTFKGCSYMIFIK